jgi:phosphatidylserine/phosphatidylglycerophosphate/cardiolipin synthase-like enzyme
MPNSKPAISALNYWIENWEEYSERAGSLAVGVLALTEFDYEYFSKYIKEMTVGLEQLQEEEGSWKKYGFSTAGDIEITSLAIAAISRTNGTTDSKCQKALEWIKRQKMELDERQKTDDDWIFQTYTYPIDAAWILLALSTMGQGLMVSKDLVEYQIMQMNQTHLKAKPIFVQTSPIYHSSLHVKEINDKIVNMIQKAKNELRISSPFIDMYYEDIINKIQENPNPMVRLITRPKGEIKGLREKIANNVIDMLNTVTRGNVIQSRTVHSRMVIVDDNELLVSSADLTRDQLFDEFNAGIWTTDKEAIKRAVDFFDNIFQLETQSKQNT